MTSQNIRPSAISLFRNGEFDAAALGQGDPRLLAADDEHVVLASGERVFDRVFEVDNVETTIVSLSVGDDANTTHVATTSDHGNGTGVELDEILDLARGQIDLHRVIDLDGRVRVSDTVR